MKTGRAENTTLRIAVMLGPGGASRYLLDRLEPILVSGRDIELQGVFLEEAGVQQAAELPFVKELCRVTFAVREFDSSQFEHTLALRMRTARQAIGVLADHAKVPFTFRNARGSALGLLKETVSGADVTVFEPARPPMSAALSGPSTSKHRQRTTAVICDTDSAAAVLDTALKFAGGTLDRLSILLFPSVGQDIDTLRTLYREHLPGQPGHVRLITEGDFKDLAITNRTLLTSMLVAPANDLMTSDRSLQFLLAQVRCPVCLVGRY
jgi:hypothetical protein